MKQIPFEHHIAVHEYAEASRTGVGKFNHGSQEQWGALKLWRGKAGTGSLGKHFLPRYFPELYFLNCAP
jgi:hypothetical protein